MCTPPTGAYISHYTGAGCTGLEYYYTPYDRNDGSEPATEAGYAFRTGLGGPAGGGAPRGRHPGRQPHAAGGGAPLHAHLRARRASHENHCRRAATDALQQVAD